MTLDLENRSWGAHPPRIWLDAPGAQLFCARRCPERSEFSGPPEVFRESAENGTRGACAPCLNFGFRVESKSIAGAFGILLILTAWLSISAEAEEDTRREASADPPKMKLRLYQEQAPHAGHITRGILVAETNQFSFVMPVGFGSHAEPSQKTATLTSRDYACSIIIRIHESFKQAATQPKPEALRAQILARYTKAKIVDEFTAAVESMSGPGVEVEWQPENASPSTSRVALVPYPGGYLEFIVQAPTNQIRKYDQAFNQLLLSFRASPIGVKLEVQSFLNDL